MNAVLQAIESGSELDPQTMQTALQAIEDDLEKRDAALQALAKGSNLKPDNMQKALEAIAQM